MGAPLRRYKLAALTQLFLTSWSVLAQGQPFNSTDFRAGRAAILAAGAAGVWITRKTEPDE